MTSSELFLNEEKSAAIAEVSVDTIRQFQRFGLLEGVEKEGQFFFREEDILKVFCLDRVRQLNENKSGPGRRENKEVSRLQYAGDDKSAQKEEVGILSHQHTEVASELSSNNQGDNLEEISSPHPVAKEAHLKESSGPITVNHNTITHTERLTPAHQPRTDLYEIMETNRNLKEQIQILREERDWLRTRLEKFEIRSEREQMLFLSSTETVRTLALQNPRREKSFLSFSLPWFKNSIETEKK